MRKYIVLLAILLSPVLVRADFFGGFVGNTVIPGATNLFLQSQTLGTTWTPNEVSISSNAAVAPDGTTTADKIVLSVGVAEHILYQPIVTASKSTVSAYFKKSEATYKYALIRYYSNVLGAYNTAYFDLDSSTNGLSTADSDITLYRTDLNNGWSRCAVYGITPLGGTVYSQLSGSTSTTHANNGDGTSGIYVWGAQLESGYPTPYIATTTTAVTRAIKVISRGF